MGRARMLVNEPRPDKSVSGMASANAGSYVPTSRKDKSRPHFIWIFETPFPLEQKILSCCTLIISEVITGPLIYLY